MQTLTTTHPVAERFRRLADGLQGQIDKKRVPLGCNPTPKRMRDYRSRLLEAENLERGQQAFRALADAHESGIVPAILAALRTKDDVLPLVMKYNVGTGYYEVIPSLDYGNTSPAAKAMQALMDQTKTPEERTADEAKAKADAIQVLEDGVQFRDLPGYFPTPSYIVGKMLFEAQIVCGMHVLEPSAGKGNIADRIRSDYPDVVLSVIEVSYALRNILEAKGYALAGDDFLEHRGSYHRIVMNPPFEGGLDVDHVRHAYDCLHPGGRLVSIMSAGPFFRRDRKAIEFREWLEDVGGSVEDLPDAAFQSSERPTGVQTKLVVIDKR